MRDVNAVSVRPVTDSDSSIEVQLICALNDRYSNVKNSALVRIWTCETQKRKAKKAKSDHMRQP